ncbi:MAG: riboflavin synthase [Pirellulales bacterium]
MFTGLVEALSTVARIVDAPPGKLLEIDASAIADGIALGDSISVSGCCLTVVGQAEGILRFQAGPETLARTNLGQLREGGTVNLERSLQAGGRLGGHFVTGHIDGLATVFERQDQGEWSTLWFTVPRGLIPQIASKGSVAIDGVSLTVVEVADDRFSVQLIPHTLAVTTLGSKQVGDRVNLETDLLAKYVATQMAAISPPGL